MENTKAGINQETVELYMPDFQTFLAMEGKEWQQERNQKDAFFEEYFTKYAMDSLDEGVLRELIHILWAFNGWTNKDWLHEQMMLKSGLPTIRSTFKKLLYGAEPLAERFDDMRNNIFMMGAACISEILTHFNHKKYPIWNSRSRKGLSILGVHETHLPKSAQISGRQYEEFCSLVENVRTEIADKHPEFTDLFHLVFFLYYISTHATSEPAPPAGKGTTEDFDHDQTIEQILELGDGLGFDVQKEYNVARGCRVDAIWRSKVANLGTIAYAFEVHRRGSRDSAILNLQRVRRDPSIQKVIVVSISDELLAFREEISSLDESFRKSVGYFNVDDLRRSLESLEQLKDILHTLGLLRVDMHQDS